MHRIEDGRPSYLRTGPSHFRTVAPSHRAKHIQANSQRFEYAGLRVLPHLVPREALPVHRDVDARRQQLRE